MKTISNLLAPLILSFGFGLAAPLAADTIAFWDFNSPVPDANPITGTTAPAFGSGTASYTGGTGPYNTGFDAGSTNDPATLDNSGWDTTQYPAQGTANKTAGVRFDVSTAGYRDIAVRWDQRCGGNSSKYFRLQYTTNGTDFVDAPPALVFPAGSFQSNTVSLAGVPGVNTNPAFAFRLVAEFESTAITNGNANYVTPTGTGYSPGSRVRFDLVTVSGTPISLPSANADLASLMLTSGTQTPAFDPAVTAYTATVLHSVTSIAMTATCADPTATLQVRVNGGEFSNILSGQTSPALALNVGTTLIDIKVTAQDLSTIKTYTAAVTRMQNQPPVADAGSDQNIYTGGTAYLRGSAIDPDGDAIILWSWTVETQPVAAVFYLDFSDQATAELQAFSPGVYVLALAVLDANYNASVSDYVTIHVADNIPPVAVATADKTTLSVGDTVCFGGSQSSDPEGGPLSYVWDFADGSSYLFGSIQICHTFTSVGTYNVLLGVTDERNAFDTDVIAITVLPPPPKLRIELTAPDTVLLAWPAAATGYSLEQNADLSTGNWQPVTNPPEVVGSENQVTLPATPPRNFFRLRSP